MLAVPCTGGTLHCAGIQPFQSCGSPCALCLPEAKMLCEHAVLLTHGYCFAEPQGLSLTG